MKTKKNSTKKRDREQARRLDYYGHMEEALKRTKHARHYALAAKVKKPLRQRVEAKFVRLMESFAVTEYREVREILRELLANCER